MAKDPILRAFEQAWRVEVRNLSCPRCLARPSNPCQGLTKLRMVSHLERVLVLYTRMREEHGSRF